MRQKRKRFLSGKATTRPKVLFPRITRQDADKDVLSMLKYLANFIFYKFGIEVSVRVKYNDSVGQGHTAASIWNVFLKKISFHQITLMMLVVLIGTRLDVVALIYSIWLCVLFSSSREKQKQLWPFFQWFIFAFISIQYISIIGLPPYLCVGKLLKL